MTGITLIVHGDDERLTHHIDPICFRRYVAIKRARLPERAPRIVSDVVS